MRSFECLREGKGRRGECLGTAYKERQEERGGGGGRAREENRREGGGGVSGHAQARRL